MRNYIKAGSKLWPAVAATASLVVVAVAIWLRNRDILREMMDYLTIVNVVGKVDAGMKPFSDVRTPMQSAVFIFNFLTERVFGASYLGLTWGGLVQAVLGGILMLRLLWRHWGPLGSWLAASALMLAGLLQHMIFFYNTLGILCLGLVVGGLAIEPRFRPWASVNSLIVLIALIIGGGNKLNYQGAALALGGMLVLVAWVEGGLRRSEMLVTAGWLVMAGCVLPLVGELWWTGATFDQWWRNVVELPTAYQGLLGRAAEAGIYLHPPYDYHHHVLVPWIAGFGLVLLVGCGAWWVAVAGRVSVRICRAVSVLVAGVLAALLLVSNRETVLLTSLAYPLFALAFLLSARRAGQEMMPWLRNLFHGALLVWVVSGGYAAWHGSRLLYGQEPPTRLTYVKVEAEEGPLAYFHGVRLLPDQLAAFKLMVERLKDFEDAQGKIPNVLLGSYFEWMERSYPETRVWGEPHSYHAGTTLSDQDVAYMRTLLGQGTKRLVTHFGWQQWPTAIYRMLQEEYYTYRVGWRDIIYVPRGAAPPAPAWRGDQKISAAQFRSQLEGNILTSATLCSENFGLILAGDEMVAGSYRASTWVWPCGVWSFKGQAVAQLRAGATGKALVTFRVLAGDLADGEVLWERLCELTPEQPRVEVPYQVEALGRQVWLLTQTDDAASGVQAAGWREVKITQAGGMDSDPPLPYNPELRLIPTTKAAGSRTRWYSKAEPSGEWWPVSTEYWVENSQPGRRITTTVAFQPVAPDVALDPVTVTLAWYRAGRFEILTEKTTNTRQALELELTGDVPEAVGWVAVLVHAANAEDAPQRWRITTWQVQ